MEWATDSTQQANRRPFPNVTGFKGVSINTGNVVRRFRATVKKNHQVVLRGSFHTAEDAARAVNAAYRIYYPEILPPNPSVL